MTKSTAPQGSGGNIKGKVGGELAAGKTFDTQDYPPTINFTSSSYDNPDLVQAGSMSRRPGGSMRGKGPWHTKCNAPSVDEPIFGYCGNPGKSEFDS